MSTILHKDELANRLKQQLLFIAKEFKLTELAVDRMSIFCILNNWKTILMEQEISMCFKIMKEWGCIKKRRIPANFIRRSMTDNIIMKHSIPSTYYIVVINDLKKIKIKPTPCHAQ